MQFLSLFTRHAYLVVFLVFLFFSFELNFMSVISLKAVYSNCPRRVLAQRPKPEEAP